MKHLKKVMLMPLMIGLMLSCEQKNEIKKLDRVTELTNQVVASTQFNSLQIKVADLDLAASKYVDVEKNSIVIPFVGRDDTKGLVAVFDANDGLRGVMEFEALTKIDSDQIYPALQNGTFNGSFIYRIGVGKISLQLENSKVISSSMARKDGSAMAFACRGLDETGGALDCAGARFENMNWAQQVFCVWQFVPCMAKLVLFCIIDGCTVQYV
jgi:hypothetical protein